MGLSRQDVARRIGVTPSAIANYENDVSFPKTELLFELFDVLQCDANYLYQDVLHQDGNFSASIGEWDFIHKYRELDAHGQELIKLVLKKELERVHGEEKRAYAAVARSKEEGPGELVLRKDFDPEAIENEADF